LSFALSLLIALPLAASPAAYVLTRYNRKFGIYFSLGLAALVFLVAA